MWYLTVLVHKYTTLHMIPQNLGAHLYCLRVQQNRWLVRKVTLIRLLYCWTEDFLYILRANKSSAWRLAYNILCLYFTIKISFAPFFKCLHLRGMYFQRIKRLFFFTINKFYIISLLISIVSWRTILPLLDF